MAPPYLDFLPSLSAQWSAKLRQVALTEPKSWWRASFLPGGHASVHLPADCTYTCRTIAQSKNRENRTVVESQLTVTYHDHTYLVSVHSSKALVLTSGEWAPRENEKAAKASVEHNAEVSHASV